MLLVDTSAWIEAFRASPTVRLADFGEFDDIVTCPPVIQEVLQGFDDERAFQRARTSIYALPCVDAPMTMEVVDLAVDLYRRARRAGLTVRSSVDCLIAASAVRHHLTVVHCDRDYDQLSRVIGLKQRNLTTGRRRR